MNRARVRAGRKVRYFPTSAEETAGGGTGPFFGQITKVNADGTVNLQVLEPDGTSLAKTSVERKERVGGYSLLAGSDAV